MISYLVIGLCIVLLLAVIIISAKPISMGIEARREVKKDNNSDEDETGNEELGEINILNNDISIADEISKLNKLKKEGTLSEEEYKKAKEKLLS